MSYYHIYVTRMSSLALRAVTDDLTEAKKCATVLWRSRGRAFPQGARARAGIAGVVTGYPVWARWKEGSEGVLITEHLSEESAAEAEQYVIHDVARLHVHQHL